MFLLVDVLISWDVIFNFLFYLSGHLLMMNDLRKEVGMQCSLTGRLVRSRMRWAGHLVRMVTSKESRGGKTSRMQKKVKATAEMGGLHEEGYVKIGGG